MLLITLIFAIAVLAGLLLGRFAQNLWIRILLAFLISPFVAVSGAAVTLAIYAMSNNHAERPDAVFLSAGGTVIFLPFIILFEAWLFGKFRKKKTAQPDVDHRYLHRLTTETQAVNAQTKIPEATTCREHQTHINVEKCIMDQPPSVKGTPTSSSGKIESSQDNSISTTVDEDLIYVAIANELESGTIDKGLWTRLFAECGGDENQTKVLYIKQRAERLISAEHLRLEQVARERAAEARQLEEIRLKNLSLRELLMEGSITEELSDKLRALSNTHAAVLLLSNVRLNKLDDVRSMLDEEPLLVAVTNSDGDTPIHIALREKHEHMVRLLLERGGRGDVKNAYGVTPLEYAQNSKQVEMANLLTAMTS